MPSLGMPRTTQTHQLVISKGLATLPFHWLGSQDVAVHITFELADEFILKKNSIKVGIRLLNLLTVTHPRRTNHMMQQ